jgi:hypothetical protein
MYVYMKPDRKAELKTLRDEISHALVRSLAHLKDLGFRRAGRSWKRPCKHPDGPATDIVDFELTVLKASVRVRMYEMRWVETRRKTGIGTTTGRMEGTHAMLLWNLASANEIPDLLAAVTDRVERVTLPWFASGGDPSSATEAYSLDEFLKENDSSIE